MKAKIIVTPKKTVLDPQGKAVEQAIHQLGMDCVKNTRIGRFIEMDIEGADVEMTTKKLNEICRDLLSNPVIEDYHLELEN
jgi:phosphoribosylformylglycinamidine synthase subunit PurS